MLVVYRLHYLQPTPLAVFFISGGSLSVCFKTESSPGLALLSNIIFSHN